MQTQKKLGRPPGGGITVDENGKKTRTYKKWSSMLQRCTNKRHPAWHYYGGRGIKVCDRWRDSFAAFLADMGKAPDGLSLDRINNDGNYEPGNCRWATSKEQAANRRHRTQVPGSLRQLARAAGLSYHLVYFRVRSGWPKAEALSTPSLGRGNSHLRLR